MKPVWAGIRAFMLAGPLAAQTPVSFQTLDGGLIYADQYGKGDRGVVLAHGGRFNRESWANQALLLAGAGFRVLAIDFRGEGQSRGGMPGLPSDEGRQFDVLAAVHCEKPARSP